MSTKNNKKVLLAALAGLAIGVANPAKALAQDAAPAGELKCYGINGCGQHASCAVKGDDIAAVRKLLGNKEFKKTFGKTKEHSCAAHASCGASFGKLNFTKTDADTCKQAGGIVIDEVDGQKVARKL